VILALSFITPTIAGGYIEGEIKLDTNWEKKAYLSYIKDFGAFYTMSNGMILKETQIDSFGKLYFDLSYLPEENNIYRIHFVKKGDPPASLIIGGKEENHFFIIANNRSEIKVFNSELNDLQNITIENSPLNTSFHNLQELKDEADSSINMGSNVNREFLQQAIFEQFRYIADTCRDPLISLYAVYQSGFEKNYHLNKSFYNSYQKKWKKNKSSYFVKFREEIPKNYFQLIAKYTIL
jgi:hypothetical protein